MKYKIGDRVDVKFIRSGNKEVAISTEIIDASSNAFYAILYDDGWLINTYITNVLHPKLKKFIGRCGWYVLEESIIGLSKSPAPGLYEHHNTGPLKCANCNQTFPYAKPNQEDGSLVCWACKNGF